MNLFSNINLYYKLTKFASDLTEVEITQFKRWFNLKKNVTTLFGNHDYLFKNL